MTKKFVETLSSKSNDNMHMLAIVNNLGYHYFAAAFPIESSAEL